MPFANYKFPQGTLTAEQKEEIIHRTTDLFAHYLGDGVRPFSMVLVDEVVDGGWGRADEVLTLAKLGQKNKTSLGLESQGDAHCSGSAAVKQRNYERDRRFAVPRWWSAVISNSQATSERAVFGLS